MGNRRRKLDHGRKGPAVLKEILSFFLPGGLLAVVSVILVNLDKVQAHLGAISFAYPPIVYSAGILLGCRFNRSALVFGAISIALCQWCLTHFSSGHPALMQRLAFDAAVLLLPLNLLVLSFVKERGFITPVGIMRLSVILAQPFLMGMAVGPDPGRFVSLFEKDILPWTYLPDLRVHQAGTIIFFLALSVIARRYFRTRSAKESGIFWSLVMLLIALNTADQAQAAFHFASASFILLLSVIELSHAMAFKDELTGLPARRALRDDLLKLGPDYCLAMLDIDHFKKFNDTHGHDVGDQVLCMVASKLAGVTGGGKAFRYGGEEFTILFPGRHAESALEHLEEVRKTVARSGFTIRQGGKRRKGRKGSRSRDSRDRQVSVTISIGAAWPGGSAATPDEVLKAADTALYRAKKGGRNRVST
jgi:diguanylate cyclase (GGDEF)-like protein